MAWESLIATKETEPLPDLAPAEIKPGVAPPGWLWPAAAVGALLLTLLVAWAAVVGPVTLKDIKVTSPDGKPLWSGPPLVDFVTPADFSGSDSEPQVAVKSQEPQSAPTRVTFERSEVRKNAVPHASVKNKVVGAQRTGQDRASSGPPADAKLGLPK